MRLVKRFPVLPMLAVALFLGVAAQAQPPAPPQDRQEKPKHAAPRKGQDAKAREMLEQVMVARISKELGLTDEQSVLLVRRFIDFRNENQKLQRERAETMKKIQALVAEGTDQQAVEDALARLRAAGESLLTLRQRQQDAISQNLDTWQRAKLVLFMDKFEEEIRQLLKQAKERRGMPPDRPAPPRRDAPPPPDTQAPPPPPGQ